MMIEEDKNNDFLTLAFFVLLILACCWNSLGQIANPPAIGCGDKVESGTVEDHTYLEFVGSSILMIQEGGVLIVDQLWGDGNIVYGDLGPTDPSTDIAPIIIFRNCDAPVTGTVNIMEGVDIQWDCQTLHLDKPDWNNNLWKRELDVVVYNINGQRLHEQPFIKYKQIWEMRHLKELVIFVDFKDYDHVERKIIQK